MNSNMINHLQNSGLKPLDFGLLLPELIPQSINRKFQLKLLKKALNIEFFLPSLNFASQMLDHKSILSFIFPNSHSNLGLKRTNQMFKCLKLVRFILKVYLVLLFGLVQQGDGLQLLDLYLVVQGLYLTTMVRCRLFQTHYLLVF